MYPAPGDTEDPPDASPAGKTRRVIAGSLVFITLFAAVIFLPGLLVPPTRVEPPPVTPAQPTTTIARTPGVTVPGSTTATPPVTTTRATAPPTTQPAITIQPVTPAATQPASTTPTGPPGFTVTITPSHATAGKGETVVYQMLIEAQNGFSGKIHMEVTASFLFFSQTQDLGFQEPPYPKTIEYPFTVPGTLPPGITINGVVRSTGDGITREDTLSLTVG
jgi:hypothetical protein